MVTDEERAELRRLADGIRPVNGMVSQTAYLAFAEAAETAVPALLYEVERLEAKAEAYKRDWYSAKSEFGTTVARLRAWERDARAAMESAWHVVARSGSDTPEVRARVIQALHSVLARHP